MLAATEVAETELDDAGGVGTEVDDSSQAGASGLATGRARYTMHEMLRQFAGAQAMPIPSNAEARSAALARHSHYYLGWLQLQTANLLSAPPAYRNGTPGRRL